MVMRWLFFLSMVSVFQAERGKSKGKGMDNLVCLHFKELSWKPHLIISYELSLARNESNSHLTCKGVFEKYFFFFLMLGNLSQHTKLVLLVKGTMDTG